MRKLRIAAKAQVQLREISAYIARESGHRELAEAFRRRLVQKARRLATLPGTLGTIRSDLGPDIRSTPVANYILIFRYTSETVDLLAYSIPAAMPLSTLTRTDGALCLAQLCVITPPSTMMPWPVMKRASSLARNVMTSAISSGWPSRLSADLSR